MQEDDYVYDETTGEWIAATEPAVPASGGEGVEVRDA